MEIEKITPTEGTSILRPSIVFVVLALISASCFFAYQYLVIIPGQENRKIILNEEAYKSSLLKNDPTRIQDLFLSDIKNGVNDGFTKSNAYFITHRYFDNGGNVYEVFDYIAAHPELSFLKEAGNIYPNIALKIKNKELKKTHSDSGMYITLALLEVLDNHKYADIATLGTLANQYAKLAYFITRVSKETPITPTVSLRLKYVQKDLDRSLLYEEKTKQEVVKFFNGELTEKDVPARDILVGLNQYAAAMRYLDMSGVAFKTPKTSREIFNFTADYSAKHVPELHLFTVFLDASTLAISASSTNQEINYAIKPFLSYVKIMSDSQLPNTNLINKILKAKDEKFEIPQDVSYDIYGKVSVTTLAEKSPEFKSWLKANGWTDADFNLNSAKATTTPVKK